MSARAQAQQAAYAQEQFKSVLVVRHEQQRGRAKIMAPEDNGAININEPMSLKSVNIKATNRALGWHRGGSDKRLLNKKQKQQQQPPKVNDKETAKAEATKQKPTPAHKQGKQRPPAFQGLSRSTSTPIVAVDRRGRAIITMAEPEEKEVGTTKMRASRLPPKSLKFNPKNDHGKTLSALENQQRKELFERAVIPCKAEAEEGQLQPSQSSETSSSYQPDRRGHAKRRTNYNLGWFDKPIDALDCDMLALAPYQPRRKSSFDSLPSIMPLNDSVYGSEESETENGLEEDDEDDDEFTTATEKSGGGQSLQRQQQQQQDRPTLPDNRSLCRMMCRIVDGDAYTENRAVQTVRKLGRIAEGASALATVDAHGDTDHDTGVEFFHHLADVGAILTLLHWTEDHMAMAECLQPALHTLYQLTRHAEKGNVKDYDDHEECQALVVHSKTDSRKRQLSESHNVLVAQVVQHRGVALFQRAWKVLIQTPQDQAGCSSGEATLDQHVARATASGQEKPSSTWQWFRGIVRDPTTLLTHACVPVLEGTSLVVEKTVGGCVPNVARTTTTSKQMNVDSSIVETTACADALQELAKLLAVVAPFINDSSISLGLLTPLCDAMPKLSTVSGDDPSDLAKLWMHCLWSVVNVSLRVVVSSTSVCKIEDEVTEEDREMEEEEGNNNDDAHRVTRATVLLMQLYPTTHEDGCCILQRSCPLLTREERKKLGVVAAIGSVLAASGAEEKFHSAAVKTICDEILADI